MKQHADEKERALQENIRKMEESNARQTKEMTDHYDKVMNDRMGEQKRLLEEGFQRQANQLREEIQRLQNRPPPDNDGCVILWTKKWKKNIDEVRHFCHFIVLQLCRFLLFLVKM